MAAMMAIAMESCRIRDRVEEWSPLLHLWAAHRASLLPCGRFAGSLIAGAGGVREQAEEKQAREPKDRLLGQPQPRNAYGSGGGAWWLEQY
jgi:hypothetical protein